jgi:hypothetical protein
MWMCGDVCPLSVNIQGRVCSGVHFGCSFVSCFSVLVAGILLTRFLLELLVILSRCGISSVITVTLH